MLEDKFSRWIAERLFVVTAPKIGPALDCFSAVVNSAVKAVIAREQLPGGLLWQGFKDRPASDSGGPE